MTAKQEIAVLGAGIGGLAAAAFLAREGHRVRIFDKFAAPGPVGSGVMIQSTGRAVLMQLGAWAALEPLTARIERLDGRTVDGARVLDVRFAANDRCLCAHGVLRPALFDALLGAALGVGAELVTDTEVVGADAVAGTAATADGRTLGSFDLVIDALGARSPMSAHAAELSYGALWATLPAAKEGFDPAALEQRYRAARQMAGVMPSGRASPDGVPSATYFWSMKQDEAAVWAQRFDAWRQEATAFWPETDALLRHLSGPDDLTFARYRHRTERSPVAGPRLVRIGDAWHATSPQLGQGANMALLDAFAVAHAVGTEAPLDTYATMRAGHVRLYQAMSWAFTPVYQSDGKVLPALRDVCAGRLMRLWPLSALSAAAVSGAVGSPLKKLGRRASAAREELSQDVGFAPLGRRIGRPIAARRSRRPNNEAVR